MKIKIASFLVSALMLGSLSFAAAPAFIQDAQPLVYSRMDGSSLTIQYPKISAPGNEAAAQAISDYFTNQAQDAKAFFDKKGQDHMRMTEEKSYALTLNDGKYLSFIDQGSLYFDKKNHATLWQTGAVFDMETGKQITNWRDLVKPGDEKYFTLKKINYKLGVSDHKLSSYFNGLTKDPTNFYLDKNRNIHFIFNQFEVSSDIIDINMQRQAK